MQLAVLVEVIGGIEWVQGNNTLDDEKTQTFPLS